MIVYLVFKRKEAATNEWKLYFTATEETATEEDLKRQCEHYEWRLLKLDLYHADADIIVTKKEML